MRNKNRKTLYENRWVSRIGRSVLLLFVTAFMTLSVSQVQANATQETRKKLEAAKEKRNETKNELAGKQSEVQELGKTKSALQNKLEDLNDQLTEVSNNLADLEQQIKDKQGEIDTTKAELEEALATEQNQYETMKKRIRFMYEKRDQMVLDLIMESGSFGDFLNRADYIEQLSAYDRKMLEQYKQTRRTVEETKARLEQEMQELTELKAQVAAEQSRVSGLVSKTSGSISAYADQIDDAKAQADQIAANLKQQESDVKALEAKLAEEIRLSQKARKSSWRDISQVSFADGDRYLLASLIYCEAGNQPYQGQLAVGAVVINRVLSSVFPDTVTGVIYQNKQFAPVADGHLALALANNSATKACYQAADEAMAGATPVGKCVFFRTPIPGLQGIAIGDHIFY